MDARDHEALSDELEKETEQLQRDSDKLGQQVQDIRQHWEHKRADDAVPGAPPRLEGDDDEPAGDGRDDSA